jgi:predicted MPP superfamily phosphohydrolase
LPRRFVVFLTVFQIILILAHGLLFLTWIFFSAPHLPGVPDAYSFDPAAHLPLSFTLLILSVSFLGTSLIGFRTTNPLLRAAYRVAAVWLGFVSFAFLATAACWITDVAFQIAGQHPERHYFAWGFLVAAALFSAYGVINGNWTRVRRISVKLAALPETWRGRSAVLVTDVHLGNLRAFGFARRLVKLINSLNPDVVFIGGDFFDGTPGDLEGLAAPLKNLQPPFGVFFVEGNHEEFRDRKAFISAIASAGVRVLNNETVELDGLQVVGVPYMDATHGEHFRKTLRQTGFDRTRANILLTHAPDRPQVSSEEGVSLQLSGHTHNGQFWPWSIFARRMYGKFVYGLQALGAMQIYTSYGAGSWGPPLRVGSNSEIVLIRFE